MFTLNKKKYRILKDFQGEDKANISFENSFDSMKKLIKFMKSDDHMKLIIKRLIKEKYIEKITTKKGNK